MKLFFVTPEKRILVDQEIMEVTLPAHRGELNILPGHAPLMTSLAAGPMKVKKANGEVENHIIAWGYCQVSSTGVSVLAEKVWDVAGSKQSDQSSSDLASQLKKVEEAMSTDILEDEQFADLQKEYHELMARSH